MHIGTQNFATQNHAAQRPAQGLNQANNHEQSGSSGRGDRLVARLDQNNDGKLSTGELQDTRLGNKISVDRFAKLDKNGDGQLEASELNRKDKSHGNHHDGPSTTERALVAKFADLLAAPAKPPEPANLGEDIAKALLTRLDKDDSGGLNSEEIAGSKLAEKIGADFYELDGDKNGALDTAELSAFITSQFLDVEQSDEMDEADEADESDEVDEVDDDTDVAPLFVPVADEVIVDTTIEPVEDVIAVSPVSPVSPVNSASTTSESSYSDSIRSSFEAALELLQQGAEQQQSAVNLVRTLYAEANKAFG